jgi:hypothetical protein
MGMAMLAAVAAFGVAFCDGSATSAPPASGAAIGAAVTDVGTAQAVQWRTELRCRWIMGRRVCRRW